MINRELALFVGWTWKESKRNNNIKRKIMKTILMLTAVLTLGVNSINAQTTAMDFQGVDCNGNNVHLFDDLDAGQAVVLFYYMPSCGSCPPPAQKIQAMANKINAACPGMVKGYAYPYQNSTTCSYSASWTSSNGLPLYAPMDSGAVQVAYYGGFGMPTVVLVGGQNHDVLWSTQNFVTSDTTVMRDLILNMACVAGINENEGSLSNFELYPNPANSSIHVNFDIESNSNVQIELIDLLGNIVLSRNEITVQNGKVDQTFDCGNLQNGNYLMKISINDKETIQKFVVSH